MKEKRFSLLQLLLALLLTAAVTLGGVALAGRLLLGPGAASVLVGLGLANTRFVGEYDPDRVTEGALGGLAAGLGDQWSYYLSPEGLEQRQETRNNSYVGVGVTVSYGDERGLLIVSVAEGSPAQNAGLTAGEVITGVDGHSLAGEARFDGVEAIQGEAGTKRTLTVLGTDGTEREVPVTLETMERQSVEYELLEGDVGYVRILNFYTASGGQFRRAVEELRGQGVTALVFDVRDNGGGYVHEMTEMLDILLPEGVIFRTQSKYGGEETVTSDQACVDLPMAVLVNGQTYSAAEFFAAQLRETAGAVVVGSQTTGKGYSQQLFTLPNGGALNLSTAAYRTGGGLSLAGVGVAPDVAAEPDGEEDVPLLRAVEALIGE